MRRRKQAQLIPSGEPLPRVNPRGAQKGVPIKRYTKAQAAEQEAIVEHALVHGQTERQMILAMQARGAAEGKPYLFVGANRIRVLKLRVHERMKHEAERTRPQSKEKQLRRLYADLLRERQKPEPKISVIAKYEELIAKIEGNFEPIVHEVDVVHREAVQSVIGAMTEEQAVSLIQGYDEMFALAKAAAEAQGRQLPSLIPDPAKPAGIAFASSGEKH